MQFVSVYRYSCLLCVSVISPSLLVVKLKAGVKYSPAALRPMRCVDHLSHLVRHGMDTFTAEDMKPI